MKVLVFDMDGTLNDFYGYKDWLECLQNERAAPYLYSKPKYDMEVLRNILLDLKGKGWLICVTSWLAKNSSKEYKKVVRQAKKEWLKKYNFPYDRISLIQYGTTKANSTRKLGGYQILIDDDKVIRDGWKLGSTIDANQDILEILKNL